MRLQEAINLIQSGRAPQGLNINLWNNDIGVEGARAIATAIQSGRAPQGLNINLGYNDIGVEGARAIATAIQSGRAPQGLSINLQFNKIGLEAKRPLAEAVVRAELVYHKQITVLYNAFEFEQLIVQAREEFLSNQRQQLICAIQKIQAKLGNDDVLTQALATVEAIEITPETTVQSFNESVQQLYRYAEALEIKSSQYKTIASWLIAFAGLLVAAALAVGLTVSTSGVVVPAVIALSAASTAISAGSCFNFFKAHQVNSNINSINEMRVIQPNVA